MCFLFLKDVSNINMYSFAFEDDAPWIWVFDHFHLGKYEDEQGKEHQNMAPKAGKHWQVVVRVIVDMLFWPYCSGKKHRVYLCFDHAKKKHHEAKQNVRFPSINLNKKLSKKETYPTFKIRKRFQFIDSQKCLSNRRQNVRSYGRFHPLKTCHNTSKQPGDWRIRDVGGIIPSVARSA